MQLHDYKTASDTFKILTMHAHDEIDAFIALVDVPTELSINKYCRNICQIPFKAGLILYLINAKQRTDDTPLSYS